MFTQAVALLTAWLGLTVTHNGRGTIYQQFGGVGSCGKAHSDNDHIVAISNYWMHSQPNSPYCGRYIQATNTGSNDGVGGKGKSLKVLVADTCPGCGENDLDFSIGAWNALTGNAPYGTFNVEWHFT